MIPRDAGSHHAGQFAFLQVLGQLLRGQGCADEVTLHHAAAQLAQGVHFLGNFHARRGADLLRAGRPQRQPFGLFDRITG